MSTAGGMLRVDQMFLRGGDPVLSADSVVAMATDQLTREQKARGGLGPDFFTGQSWSFCQAVQDSGAFGWDGGFGTSWLVDPGRDLVVIVLTQRMFATGTARAWSRHSGGRVRSAGLSPPLGSRRGELGPADRRLPG